MLAGDSHDVGGPDRIQLAEANRGGAVYGLNVAVGTTALASSQNDGELNAISMPENVSTPPAFSGPS